MKMITINVDEAVYRRFREAANRGNRSASELIREAMAEYDERTIPDETSIFDGKHAHVERILTPLSQDDDLLGEARS